MSQPPYGVDFFFIDLQHEKGWVPPTARCSNSPTWHSPRLTMEMIHVISSCHCYDILLWLLIFFNFLFCIFIIEYLPLHAWLTTITIQYVDGLHGRLPQ